MASQTYHSSHHPNSRPWRSIHHSHQIHNSYGHDHSKRQNPRIHTATAPPPATDERTSLVESNAGYIFVAAILVLYAVIFIAMWMYNNRKTSDSEANGDPQSAAESVFKSMGLKRDNSGDDGSQEDDVVKVRSSVDGRKYFVASSLGDKTKAANKLAEIQRRSQRILEEVNKRLSGGKRIFARDGVDITQNMQRLVEKHHRKQTPFAEYYNKNAENNTVGSNSNKGMLIQVCLRNKFKPEEFNEDNTLLRVFVHELAHSSDEHYRGDGDHAHGPDFFRLHKYLLRVAEDVGVYSCAQYKSSNGAFCGLRLTEEADCD